MKYRTKIYLTWNLIIAANSHPVLKLDWIDEEKLNEIAFVFGSEATKCYDFHDFNVTSSESKTENVFASNRRMFGCRPSVDSLRRGIDEYFESFNTEFEILDKFRLHLLR